MNGRIDHDRSLLAGEPRMARGRAGLHRVASDSRLSFRALLTVGGLSLLVKVVAMLRELIVADYLGTSDDLDAYLVAFIVPSFLVNVLAGSLNAALVPAYIEVRDREGREAAQRLFDGVVGFTIGILGAARRPGAL